MNELRWATPGIYRLAAAQPDLPDDWLRIQVPPVATAESLHGAISGALSFPDWYRGTWDGLLDCLTDLSWQPAPGYVIVWTDYGQLAQGHAVAWRTAFEVLREAASRRVELGFSPLYVLLVGSGPAEAPDGSLVPLL